MQPITVRVFVSSTWLDLQPERDTLESLLQRFRETKFIGMEYFGSRDETTRRASLDEIDQSDIYLGVIGGRTPGRSRASSISSGACRCRRKAAVTSRRATRGSKNSRQSSRTRRV